MGYCFSYNDNHKISGVFFPGVFSETCNRVLYPDRSICAFRGSTVNISCSYRYWNPSQPKWFSLESFPQQLNSFQSRFQVFEPKRGHSTLRISDLESSDSAEYRFIFSVGRYEWKRSLPGTTLTVTGTDQHLLLMQS